MGAIDDIADAAASEIADAAVEAASEILDSEPVNEGQESLCSDMQDDVMAAWDDVFNGNPQIEINTPHPEAVGEIALLCQEILMEAAFDVKIIREAAQIGDAATAGGGDAE